MPKLAPCYIGFLAATLGVAAPLLAQPTLPQQQEQQLVEPAVPSHQRQPVVPPASPRIISLTLSPLHLQFPVIELMAEVRLYAAKRQAVSMAFIAGYGELAQAVEGHSGLDKQTLNPTAGQLGGQLIYYPLGDFRSLQIGGEIMYVKYLGFDLAPGQRITTLGDGLAVGPFLGYKHIERIGLTLSGQLGIDYMVKRTHAPNAETGETSSPPSKWFPLLNVNVGWSF